MSWSVAKLSLSVSLSSVCVSLSLSTLSANKKTKTERKQMLVVLFLAPFAYPPPAVFSPFPAARRRRAGAANRGPRCPVAAYRRASANLRRGTVTVDISRGCLPRSKVEEPHLSNEVQKKRIEAWSLAKEGHVCTSLAPPPSPRHFLKRVLQCLLPTRFLLSWRCLVCWCNAGFACS